MFEHIRHDIKRLQKTSLNNLSKKLDLYIFSFGLHALIVYRFGHWLLSIRTNCFYWPLLLITTPLYWCMSAYVRLAYDIHLDPAAEIGPGLFIGHFGGIKVLKCTLGANCAIQQEVRLQPVAGGQDGPQIGNRVWIGAHVQIQGGISVGDGATIGAGAMVKENVGANNLVLGNPARTISIYYDNSKFL